MKIRCPLYNDVCLKPCSRPQTKKAVPGKPGPVLQLKHPWSMMMSTRRTSACGWTCSQSISLVMCSRRTTSATDQEGLGPASEAP